MLRSGLAKAVAFCPGCKRVVELDFNLHCPGCGGHGKMPGLCFAMPDELEDAKLTFGRTYAVNR
jgi:predicted amidophosphoribosyltransferase